MNERVERTPVVIGVGQYTQQVEDAASAEEQTVLMERAVRRAADDAGRPRLLEQADRIVAIGGMWSYPDPGRVIAEAVGARGAATMLTAMGGNMPQYVVSWASAEVAAGRADIVVITGGEAVYSKNKLRALGRSLPRTGGDLAPAERLGTELPMSSPHEIERGFRTPTQVYPLFESAIRAARGEGHDEHRARIARLWQRLNSVAVANPHAWLRRPMTAEEIATPSDDNRMVGYPYTKAMNANSFVDMAAAVIVCSTGTADRLGIAEAQRVYPVAGTDASATAAFSERHEFHASPAAGIAGRRCLELAGLDIDEVGPIDLYSCFPSMVEMIMDQLSIPEDRQITTTGGLSFFGGPMNSYVLHAIASTVEAVRSSGRPGYVHGNGGYATKQSCGVYAPAPSSVGFRHEDCQPAADVLPTRSVDEEPAGAATIESCTVLHGRGGPQEALFTALRPDGRRALARSSEGDVMAAVETEELIGRPVELTGDGQVVDIG